MTKYLIVTVGARPDKDPETKKYLPMPKENAEFIQAALGKVSPTDIVAIWHGADTFGVDLEVERYATARNIRQRQYPAYWQNWDAEKSQFVTDKLAGAKRTQHMLRNAKDAVYQKGAPNDRKPDHVVVLLCFGDKEDKNIQYAVDYVSRLSNNPFVVNYLPLPVAPSNPNGDVETPFAS